ncbi:MAG: hypothetical protein ABI648_10885 [Betaproteobacteria bacterium]
MKPLGIVAAIGLFSSGQAFAEPTTYDLTVRGKSCQESSLQSVECNYSIGKSLRISIAGLGQPDTGVTFMKSDFDGDFYASVGLKHGCVIVKPGKKSLVPGYLPTFAFISPKNGKVYKDWEECQAGY